MATKEALPRLGHLLPSKEETLKPYGLVEQQGRDYTVTGRTPSNTPKRRGRKQAISRTPARGQSTILQYMGAKKTTNSAVGAAYQDTEEVPVQQTDDYGV